ncbi:hypothetical protein EDD93_3697 [Streptomyces sp. 840.1]|uniref:hypothetical protein n=1 Tax=Streptomyces sp. 840.1 TaxID=2485152 RepID=UPI000F93EC2A|nr:hypothetical protein [Streptomyces sp. 840.1]ROQ69200.1 hypothetical protein EDD93_3697 [Streptomyces sp. 840.1]
MILALAILAALAAGYGVGRYRPAHRASDWANWQKYGKRPTGARYWAMFTVLSAENIGWLLTHPVRGWDAWKHRTDPPPPLSPPVRIRTDIAATEEST